jgi:hypothetical protein
MVLRGDGVMVIIAITHTGKAKAKPTQVTISLISLMMRMNLKLTLLRQDGFLRNRDCWRRNPLGKTNPSNLMLTAMADILELRYLRHQ